MPFIIMLQVLAANLSVNPSINPSIISHPSYCIRLAHPNYCIRLAPHPTSYYHHTDDHSLVFINPSRALIFDLQSQLHRLNLPAQKKKKIIGRCSPLITSACHASISDQPPHHHHHHTRSVSTLRRCTRFAKALIEMSRLQNYIPSMLLVFVGSWMAAGKSMVAFSRSSVWITAFCSALITVASMLSNDIFDYRSGTDHFNKKNTPLLNGQIHPNHVEVVAGCLYGVTIIGLCYLEPLNLRLLIGGATIATYVYTPFLKRLTMVKNMVVSAIISSSILAGAMAMGGKEHVGNPIVATSLFIFLCILGREILMDVEDMVGDKAAGVKTLAVCFGRRISTITASLCLAAANGVLISFLGVKAKAYATLGTLSLLPLHAMLLRIWKNADSTADSTFKSIKYIIEQSMVHIGIGFMVLASAA